MPIVDQIVTVFGKLGTCRDAVKLYAGGQAFALPPLQSIWRSVNIAAALHQYSQDS